MKFTVRRATQDMDDRRIARGFDVYIELGPIAFSLFIGWGK